MADTEHHDATTTEAHSKLPPEIHIFKNVDTAAKYTSRGIPFPQ
jgi:hypothetical protein